MRWDDLARVCPKCRAALSASAAGYTCANGHAYPIVAGIPRFVSAENYAESFGFEWTMHDETQLDSKSGRLDSHEAFDQKLGLGPDDLDGRLVLDVGVGSGRFAEVAVERGARVVGIDLSRAVEAAARNLGDRASIAQADLFHLPFAQGTFDVVYSIGVLHHTPNTAAAVRAIAPLVKPGGTLAIWLYERGLWYRMADLYRNLTTRMSDRALYRLCRLLARLYPLHQLPLVGAPLRFLLPVSGQANFEWRVLDTFDWYAPTYQWKHTEDEVVGWFRELGFEGIEVLADPVSVRGTAPTGTTQR